MRILLVEDDKSLANVVQEALKQQNYIVDWATDGQAGYEFAESFEYDIILLNLVLPKLNGIYFCQRRRDRGDRTPILLIAPQDDKTQKVQGLDAGADDYMVKPFDLEELLARIRALLRRGNEVLPPVIEWGLLRLDPSACQVSCNGTPLKLTAKEYGLLELFLRQPHRIFSQSDLLDHLWSFETPPSETAVRTQIKGLRRKLKQGGVPADPIETLYGLGYRLKPQAEGTRGTREQGSRGAGEQGSRGAGEQGRQGGQGDKGNVSRKPSKLDAIWQQHQQKYLDRVAVVERAIAALRSGKLDEPLWQEGFREAHTLAGAVGIFGFKEASQKSRQIEQILRAGEQLSPDEIDSLAALAMEVRQDIESGNKGHQEDGEDSGVRAYKADKGDPGATKSPRILIVDDDAALVQALEAEAIARGMEVETASDIVQARNTIDRHRPDVVLLDLCFPDSMESGLELLESLTQTQPPMPVLVFTARESFATRVKVARLGGRGFLHKPLSIDAVMEAIASELERSSPPAAKLMIVDDDPQSLEVLQTFLEPWGFTLTLLSDPQDFWETLERSNPDLLVLDIEMPQLNGIELCQVVRQDPRWQDLPVLFLSAHSEPQTVRQVFEVGADDYIQKPISEQELIARVLNRLKRHRNRR